MQCNKCKYFFETEKGHHIGECRRYPPSLRSLYDTERFPAVETMDYCGEHKKFNTSKTNKVKKES